MTTHGKILLWMTICALYLNSWPQNRFMINRIYILAFFQARTMSYQQKVIENGNNSAAEDDPSRKTSLTSRPNIKELTHKQRNWFSSFEKNRSQEVRTYVFNDDAVWFSVKFCGNTKLIYFTLFQVVTSVDSVRRTSVKNDHTPNLLSGSGGECTSPAPQSLPPDATPTPASNLFTPRDRRPLSARGSTTSDSIEDYIRNWKKSESPLSSPSSYESGR